MEKMFFYFEPYVYVHTGVNGVLLVNLLDDKSFLFSDKFSYEIASQIQVSKMKSVALCKEELHNEIIKCSIENYLGDVIVSEVQPVQFSSELNVLSGEDAYKKTIKYTKYNIYKNIKQCVVFAHQNLYDVQYFLSLKKGCGSSDLFFPDNYSWEIDHKNLMRYMDTLFHLNSEMRLFLCGALFDFIVGMPVEYQSRISYIFTLKTLFENKELWDSLENTNLHYIIMLDDERYDLNRIYECHSESVWIKISGEESLSLYKELKKQGTNIKPFLVLNSDNVSFMESMVKFSKSALLQLKNKYRVIKNNNLVNTNWWGSIYLFPNGLVTYSLEDITQGIGFSDLCQDFKTKFFHCDFGWSKTRNYPKCNKCVFQWLCPSPSLLEDELRRKKILDCLLVDE